MGDGVRYSIDMDGLAPGFIHATIIKWGIDKIAGGGGGGGGGGPKGLRPGRPGAAQQLGATASSRCPSGWEKNGRCLSHRGDCTSGWGVSNGPCLAAIGTSMIAADPGASGGCPGLMNVSDGRGGCVNLMELGGGGVFPQGGEIGAAVMGRYGAGYHPASRIIDRAVCLPGDVVGNDGICYPKRSLRNKDRAWPRGRRPLLTGGEMRAISVASRAATRLTNTAVRLQDMGLIKKPVARKRPKKKA